MVRSVFKSEDLIKLDLPDLQTCCTYLVSHLVRAASNGDIESVGLILEAIEEIAQFGKEVYLEKLN